ncbi:cyclodeaminase/cyclohydrolase family protein [Melioribacteraceae bacterium 4301-Me]|uniref:cyclodeaminase/cyclohydrolase family protein n=1 Tax=Pyranulibacter aquaticus TaxID=3163344 RepID=UPI00359BFCD3
MNHMKTIDDYLKELSSSSPTPGGGNVSAFCGALASSLALMVCNLTIGKKKYAEVENTMQELKLKFETYQKKFIELSEKDNEAFNSVMEAYKLPKDTDEQKETRSKKIEEATFNSAEIPSEVIKTCYEMMPLIKDISEKGNVNSISDAGVAALLISLAAEGAYLNVLINCNALTNQTLANELRKQVGILLQEVTSNARLINQTIISKLSSKAN